MVPEIPNINQAEPAPKPAGQAPEIPNVNQAKPEITNVNSGEPAPKPAEPAPKPAEQVQTQVATNVTMPSKEELLTTLRNIMLKPFELANAQGKYVNKPAIGSALMYINSELAEAHEAYASGRHASSDDISICDKLLAEGKDESFCKYFKAVVKSTFEDEMADIVLMSLSIAGYYNVDIAKHVMLKHQYNQLRQEHSAITTNG